MKKSILALFVVAFVMVSCNQKNKQDEPLNNTMMENDTTMMHNDTTMHHDSKMMDENTKLYACPMHPEVQGKLNDKCSKCGMKLTEEVK
ncbi:heavy metal-binding domain-containing protein [Flavobacterium cellulosilyticum]|uniref:Heavy metal binding domain-containing protein n=1 Tax=Flavobacterium cellulosilyticum TaxID=2541731 RepID=A0A4R5CAW1_9FLAO|nr:heavy metal-binding domain-containing protein [Flavobacterium cellulosilyticum]TDD97081.1 hypothetical protein E0F76_10625 [Flavobacterium cellulosilyticum]